MSNGDAIRLTIREPSGQEREVLLERDVTRIGRARDCDLPLDSGYISRYHARIERSGRTWEIVDEGSKNGVILNGRRVSRSHALFPGDSIRLGDFTLIVQLAEEQDFDRTVIYPFAQPAELGEPLELEETPTPPVADAVAPPPVPTVPAEPARAATPLRPARLVGRELQVFTVLEAATPEAAPAQRLGDAAWEAGAWDRAMLERLIARLDRQLRDESWPGVVSDDRNGFRLLIPTGTG
ncbi:MAG TPA: FHA domain-containing protein [Dehalococcoidia bacterium]|jgi:pSer/pThr/pTyr-binding forkhead associated (FHA) protein